MPQSSAPEQVGADPRLRQAEALLQSGNFAAAAAICREIIFIRPGDSGALQLLGIALLNQGELEAARETFVKYTKLEPNSVSGLALLATVHLQRSEWDAAESWCRKAIALEPDFVQAYLNLGLALHSQGRFDEAVVPLQEATHLRPDFAAAWLQLGVTLLAMRDLDKALEAFDRTISLSPRSFEGYYNRGLALTALNRLVDAEISFARSADLNPGHEPGILAFAHAMQYLQRNMAAIAALRQALKTFHSESPAVHALLAEILTQEGWSRESRKEIERALELDPNNPEYLLFLAKVLSDLGRHEDASSIRQQALERAPDSAAVLTALGYEHLGGGRKTEAVKAFRKLEELWPQAIGTHLNLAMVQKFVPGDERLDALLNFTKDETRLSREDRTELHFSLGRAFDELGDYDRAFEHFAQANEIQDVEIPDLEKALVKLDKELKSKITRQFVALRREFGSQSRLPIFIIGMPRSGTTLVEQFVSMHPQVSAAGEVKDFVVALREIAHRYRLSPNAVDLMMMLPREGLASLGDEYVARVKERVPDSTRVTDKLPSNYQYAGLIHLALPKAKIIHCVRSPLDCCFSIFSNRFADSQEHTRDLERLARAYRRYHDLMQHWHSVLPEGTILDVRYEDLVGDFEPMARRVIDYCELPWDPVCLEFQRSERPVETLSINQVRQPIYQTSVERWRYYERHLGPLIAGLGDLVRR